jgi:hypothetical protein
MEPNVVKMILQRGIWDRTGIMVESEVMKTRIYSNEIEAPLTKFIGDFLGNVCMGITLSLKTPQPIRTLKYEIRGEDVFLEVNGSEVPMNLNSGFSKVIVSNTIRGMVRHLKLADPEGTIRIEADMDA